MAGPCEASFRTSLGAAQDGGTRAGWPVKLSFICALIDFSCEAAFG
jgi:hypothetical protein